MKIRSGFVSNSSSSSFIINAEGDFLTVKDVAKYMISVCLSMWTECDYTDELICLRNTEDPDMPVFFNTGDETYIRKIDDKIVISTTQNIRFEKISKASLNSKELTDDFYKNFDYINEYGEKRTYNKSSSLEYYYNKFNDFLILKHNIRGKESYKDKCPHCNNFSSGWELQNGDYVCQCQIKNYIRKTKLDKLNENSNS